MKKFKCPKCGRIAFLEDSIEVESIIKTNGMICHCLNQISYNYYIANREEYVPSKEVDLVLLDKLFAEAKELMNKNQPKLALPLFEQMRNIAPKEYRSIFWHSFANVVTRSSTLGYDSMVAVLSGAYEESLSALDDATVECAEISSKDRLEVIDITKTYCETIQKCFNAASKTDHVTMATYVQLAGEGVYDNNNNEWIKSQSVDVLIMAVEMTKLAYKEMKLSLDKEDLENSINIIRKYNPDYVGLSKKGCYIATCVYNSYDCPQVWRLRRYRDEYLDTHWWGKLFIKFYYFVSPTVVKIFKNNKLFKKISKRFLDAKIKKLEKKGYEDTPYSDKY